MSRRSDTKARATVAILAIIAGPVLVMYGYGGLAAPSVCKMINNINAPFGESKTCATSPAPGYWIGGALLVLAGLACLAPWILRWLTGRGGSP